MMPTITETGFSMENLMMFILLDAGYWMLVSRCSMLDARCWSLDAGYLVTG
jgi:hypothetical protein